MELSIDKKKLALNRNFLFLWVFQLLSLFGSELTRFALPIWVFQKEENLISFTVFVCCGLLARIFSPISGGLIDCLNKKKVLVASGCFLIVVSSVIILIVTGFIIDDFLTICCLIFLIGIFSNLIHIATLSIIPLIVKKDQLLKANSFMIAAESSAVLVCPLLAGSLIFIFGIPTVVLTDILMFIISLIFLMRVDLEENILYKKNLKTHLLILKLI